MYLILICEKSFLATSELPNLTGSRKLLRLFYRSQYQSRALPYKTYVPTSSCTSLHNENLILCNENLLLCR